MASGGLSLHLCIGNWDLKEEGDSRRVPSVSAVTQLRAPRLVAPDCNCLKHEGGRLMCFKTTQPK